MTATVHSPYAPAPRALDGLGPAPAFAWLPVDGLAIDEAYQRRVDSKDSQTHINAIAAGFDWAFFQALTVTKVEDGRHMVIDGQHRLLAARRVGLAEVPCLIVAAQGRARQAAAFLALNGARRRVHTVYLFHARLAAGDASAKATVASCAAAGVTIPRSTDGRALTPSQTLAVATVERLVRRRGPDHAAETLRLARDAGRRLGEHWLKQDMLAAIDLARAEGATPGQLEAALGTRPGLGDWLRAAHQVRVEREALATALARLLTRAVVAAREEAARAARFAAQPGLAGRVEAERRERLKRKFGGG